MTVIDDCYNANPVSMRSSIEVLSHAKGRTIACLLYTSEANKWELSHGGISGRTATQFVNYIMANN